MSWITGGVAAVLLFIALLHLLWGLRITWPARDEPTLGGLVAGRVGPMAPFAACAAVAVALSAAAFIVTMWRVRPHIILTLGYWTIVAVFAVRGLAAYTPIFDYSRATPFHRLNQLYYGPLCLLIAGALIFDAVRAPG